MRRLPAILVPLAVLLLAGCGDGGGSGSETTATTPRDGAAAKVTVSIYLLRGEELGAAHRRVTKVPAIASAALRQLLRGPNAIERAARLTTAIPSGTRLLGLTIANGTATVDLSRRFESGGGSASMQARVAQVVFTLTRFPTVKRVAFRIEGEPVDAIGGEGVVVDPPVDRADFEAVSPVILVEDPAVGDRVRSPLRVSGTSNTFEASLTVRVRAADGRRLAQRDIQATSGTGTRGRFRTTLRFTPPADARTITLEALEFSAKDGRPIHRVRVPLRLR